MVRLETVLLVRPDYIRHLRMIPVDAGKITVYYGTRKIIQQEETDAQR
jgi:hypothetical protein